VKKSLLILSAVLLISVFVYPQNKGDLRIGLYQQTYNTGKYNLPQFGVSGELFLNKSISLNYNYSMGINANREVMGHINVASIGVALSVWYLYELAPYIFMIPEGISYHAYPNEKVEIAPYINPLGAEINFNENYPLLLSCSFGINLHFKPTEKFSITPNIGAMWLYKTGEINPSFGLSLNYNFENLIF